MGWLVFSAGVLGTLRLFVTLVPVTYRSCHGSGPENPVPGQTDSSSMNSLPQVLILERLLGIVPCFPQVRLLSRFLGTCLGGLQFWLDWKHLGGMDTSRVVCWFRYGIHPSMVPSWDSTPFSVQSIHASSSIFVGQSRKGG